MDGKKHKALGDRVALREGAGLWLLLALAVCLAVFASGGCGDAGGGTDGGAGGGQQGIHTAWEDTPADTAAAVPGGAEPAGGSPGRPGGAGQPDAAEGADTAPGAPPATEQPPKACFVHVCGQVVSPGVYELAEGSRVYEAVAMAGGFTDQAAEDYLNLAEPVRDGMKLEVPDKSHVEETTWPAAGTPGTAGSGAAGLGGAAPSAGAARVNINTASAEELMTLTGIGQARAEAIIRYRQERGGFGRIEDIMEVSGIKDAAFQKIKDDITV